MRRHQRSHGWELLDWSAAMCEGGVLGGGDDCVYGSVAVVVGCGMGGCVAW